MATTIILDRFWRKPTPSSNVCQRLTRILILKDGRGTVVRWLSGHDETANSIKTHLGADSVVDMGTTELSLREFRTLKMSSDPVYTLAALKGEDHRG